MLTRFITMRFVEFLSFQIFESILKCGVPILVQSGSVVHFEYEVFDFLHESFHFLDLNVQFFERHQ